MEVNCTHRVPAPCELCVFYALKILKANYLILLPAIFLNVANSPQDPGTCPHGYCVLKICCKDSYFSRYLQTNLCRMFGAFAKTPYLCTVK